MSFENLELVDAMKTAKNRHSIEELEVLLSRTADFNSSIKEALELVCNSLNGEVGTFWVYNQLGDGLIHAKETYGSYSLEDIVLLPGEGIVGQCIETNKPIFVYNCQKDDRWAGRVDKKTGFLTKSIICAPLIYQNTAFACIQIVNKKENDYFDEKDLELLEALSRFIVEGYIKRKLIKDNMLTRGNHQIDVLNGKIVDAAAMFVIINDFNTLITRVGVDRAVTVINTLLVYIGSIVEENSGHVDKCVGDSVMAVYENSAYAVNAIKSAQEIIAKKDDLIKKINSTYSIELGFSIGISSGRSYVGGIGGKGLADHTVLGESVINASILGIQAKNNEILVSQELVRELNGKDFKFKKSENEKILNNSALEAYSLVK